MLLYVWLVLLTTAVGILSPFIIGTFLDSLIDGGDLSVILRFCAIFGSINLIKICSGYITAVMYTKLYLNMGYRFNIDVIHHVHDTSLSYSSKHDSAYLSQRVGQDTNELIVFCISVMQSALTNIIMLVVPVIIIITMNWFVALLLVCFLVVYAALYFMFKKPLYYASLANREALNTFFARLYEQLKYVTLIKINSIQKEIGMRSETGFSAYKNTAIHNQKLNYLYSGLDGIVSTIAQIVLFVAGGLQVLAGNFTIGMFTIFASYFGMILGSTRYFFGMGAFYQRTMTAYDRVVEILNQKRESCGVTTINDIHKINLRNVIFSYQTLEDEKKVLKDFTAEFVKGKTYCVAGPNGSGKSTLIKLIIGLYVDEYSGSITFDGVDIRDLNLKDIRKRLIGFSEQEPMLINGSIGYNLTYNNNCQDSVAVFLKKYENILNMENFLINQKHDAIDENNINTSGGEKQKLSILKVLYKNPAVLIFDEPTSALDAETAKKFIQHLNKIKKDKIIILITHDEKLKQLCDVVYDVADAKIIKVTLQN